MAEPALYGDPPPGARPRWLTTPDGARLRLVLWPADGAARGVVLVLQGRAEFVEKYYETVERLRDLGFSVVAFDWRTQGLSSRADPWPRRGHIDDFGLFRADLAAVMAAPEFAGHPGRRIMLAHSMGGCIGLPSLLAPSVFDAAILSAPMLGLAMPPLLARVTPGLAGGLGRLGLSLRYASGCDDDYVSQRGFEDNVLTGDRARFERFASILDAHPEVGLGGVTWGWISAAFRAMADPALHAPQAVAVPTLLLRADDDRVVSNAAIDALAARNDRVECLSLPGSQHEPLQEKDAIQARVWSRIGEFLADEAVRTAGHPG